MINLFNRKALQDTIMVGGSAFRIHTDYRIWIRFVHEYETWDKKGTLDISYLFMDDMPGFCERKYIKKYLIFLILRMIVHMAMIVEYLNVSWIIKWILIISTQLFFHNIILI